MSHLRKLMRLGIALLAQISLAFAADLGTYIAGLNQTLNTYVGARLGHFGSLLSNAPVEFLQELMNGSHTLIASTDYSLRNFEANAGDLANNNYDSYLRYHVLAGKLQTVPDSQAAVPIDVAYRTLLRGGPYANLPGDQAQVLIFAKYAASGGRTQVSEPLYYQDLLGSASYQNLDIQILNDTLLPPDTVANTIAANVSSYSLMMWAGWINGLTNNAAHQLDSLQGFTAFAIGNDIFTADVNRTIASYTDANQKSAIFNNFYIPGVALYGSMIDDNTTLTTAGGQSLTFSVNSSGTFVKSGTTTARFIAPDIVVAGGVIHGLDQPLINTNVDNAVAASAASSVSSVVATQTSIATGPLGPSPPGDAVSAPPSSAASSAPPSGSSSSSSSSTGGIVGGAVGGVIALVLLLLGILFFLRRRRRRSTYDDEDGGDAGPKLPIDADVVEAYEVPRDAPRPDMRELGAAGAQAHETQSLLWGNAANEGGGTESDIAGASSSEGGTGFARRGEGETSNSGSGYRRGSSSGPNGTGIENTSAGEVARQRRPSEAVTDAPTVTSATQGHSSPTSSRARAESSHDVASIATAAAEMVIRRMMGHTSSPPGEHSSADYWAGEGGSGGETEGVGGVKVPTFSVANPDEEAGSSHAHHAPPPAYEH